MSYATNIGQNSKIGKKNLISKITIPRWNQFTSVARAVEIHCFSDASKQAYGATLYLRILTDARASVSLQLAKSKVAPLKILSIPRLEFAAFHLASKLTKHYFQRTKLHLCSSVDGFFRRLVLAKKTTLKLESFCR